MPDKQHKSYRSCMLLCRGWAASACTRGGLPLASAAAGWRGSRGLSRDCGLSTGSARRGLLCSAREKEAARGEGWLAAWNAACGWWTAVGTALRKAEKEGTLMGASEDDEACCCRRGCCVLCCMPGSGGIMATGGGGVGGGGGAVTGTDTGSAAAAPRAGNVSRANAVLCRDSGVSCGSSS